MPILHILANRQALPTQALYDDEKYDFICKPITSTNLLDSLLRALGHKDLLNLQSTSTALAEQSTKGALQGAKILLVEDNEINQELATELLNHHGIEVVVANNGQEAIDFLNSEYFDGVLMDCQMPVKDGYTATKEIRKNPKFKDLAIIAMTANVMAGDREKAIQSGMNEHIGKPINTHELFTKLAQWVTPSIANNSKTLSSQATNSPITMPELDGIDIKAGLAIAQNDQVLYRRLLLKFKDNYADTIESMAAAASNKDFETIENLAHNLKGVAGNIAAKQLYKYCQLLEDNAVEHDIKPLIIAQCQDELSRILTTLAQLEHPVPTELDFDLSACKVLLAQLVIDVDNYDVAAIDTIRTLLSMTPQQAYHQQLKDLMAKIESYEFDDAALLLKTISIA